MSGTPTFVIPHYLNSDAASRCYLNKTVQSVMDQTDDNWNMVIVDDLSPQKETIEYLDHIKSLAPKKIHIIKKNTHDGPGVTRNKGVEWAYGNGAPFVLFLDADDMTHPKRVEVSRRLMESDSLISVVYSTFKIVDENDDEVPFERITGSIQEILEGHKTPPQGFNAWIQIGTETGYTNCSSSTNVRTALAYRYPFPNESISEDSYTWLQYSAGGGKFVYDPEILSYYRIPQNKKNSTSRDEFGEQIFYQNKCRVDREGFFNAVEIALKNGKINHESIDSLVVRFYLRLAQTMRRERCYGLARQQLDKAKIYNREIFERITAHKTFEMLQSEVPERKD